MTRAAPLGRLPTGTTATRGELGAPAQWDDSDQVWQCEGPGVGVGVEASSGSLPTGTTPIRCGQCGGPGVGIGVEDSLRSFIEL
eukprot:364507-Chlamydomonas_euryale.AAC.14